MPASSNRQRRPSDGGLSETLEEALDRSLNMGRPLAEARIADASTPPKPTRISSHGSIGTAEEALSPRPRKSSVHWSTSDLPSCGSKVPERRSEAQLQRRNSDSDDSPSLTSRSRSPSTAMLSAVMQALERHPSFARKIGMQLAKLPAAELQAAALHPAEPHPAERSPPQSPRALTRGRSRVFSSSFWTAPPSRAFWRHTFYVAITLALLLVSVQLVYLRRSDHEQREVVESALHKSISTEFRLVLRSALTAQSALIAVNIFLAFRGVQIWSLIQRVKVVPLLERIGWIDRWRRGRLITWVTAPIRTPIKALLYPGRLAAERAAREAAAREAALRAKRYWPMYLAARMADNGVRMGTRMADNVMRVPYGWLSKAKAAATKTSLVAKPV